MTQENQSPEQQTNKFVPDVTNITAAEIALILSMCNLTISDAGLDQLPPSLRRHFQQLKS